MNIKKTIVKILIAAMIFVSCLPSIASIAIQNKQSILSVRSLTEILDFEKVSENKAKVYYFSVLFNKDLASTPMTDFQNTDLSDGNVIDHVYINGKSIRTINELGVKNDGAELKNGVQVHLGGHNGDSAIRLVFYISKELSSSFGIKMDGTDEIEIKKGFTSQSGYIVEQPQVFVFNAVDNQWSEKILSNNIFYTPTKVLDLSPMVEIGGSDANTGKRSQMFLIYFNKDVSYQSMPLISGSKSFLTSLLGSGVTNYKESDINKIDSYGIRDSIVDYIKIDGKTIREKIAQDDPILVNTTISANYEGAEFNSKALGIYFSSAGKNLIDITKTHTLEIATGFKTPLFTITTSNQKFIFVPEYKAWLSETDALKFSMTGAIK